MLTRSLVAAILLLAAISCDRDLPTQPTAPPEAPPRGTQGPPELATDIVGDYRLAFTASPSCSLPTELTKRTYKASVRAWVNNKVAVDVYGATFFQAYAAGFDGTRSGDTVQFHIVGLASDIWNYSLAEWIDGTTWLKYDGAAVATISGNNISSGAFDGQIALVALRDAAPLAVLAECRATDHKIEFAR